MVALLASDYLCISAVQVRIPLAMSVLKNYQAYQIVPASVCFNGLTVTIPGAVVSQGISQPKVKNCPGFPPPLDSWHLRSRIAYLSKIATSVRDSLQPHHSVSFEIKHGCMMA